MIQFSSIRQYFLIFFTLVLALGLSMNSYAQFKYSKTCITECQDTTAATMFRDTLKIVATAWRWDFGDLASGVKNTSTQKNPAHLYNSSGPKIVT
jgi:uncharacterized membrane protein